MAFFDKLGDFSTGFAGGFAQAMPAAMSAREERRDRALRAQKEETRQQERKVDVEFREKKYTEETLKEDVRGLKTDAPINFESWSQLRESDLEEAERILEQRMHTEISKFASLTDNMRSDYALANEILGQAPYELDDFEFTAGMKALERLQNDLTTYTTNKNADAAWVSAYANGQPLWTEEPHDRDEFILMSKALMDLQNRSFYVKEGKKVFESRAEHLATQGDPGAIRSLYGDMSRDLYPPEIYTLKFTAHLNTAQGNEVKNMTLEIGANATLEHYKDKWTSRDGPVTAGELFLLRKMQRDAQIEDSADIVKIFNRDVGNHAYEDAYRNLTTTEDPLVIDKRDLYLSNLRSEQEKYFTSRVGKIETELTQELDRRYPLQRDPLASAAGGLTKEDIGKVLEARAAAAPKILDELAYRHPEGVVDRYKRIKTFGSAGAAANGMLQQVNTVFQYHKSRDPEYAAVWAKKEYAVVAADPAYSIEEKEFVRDNINEWIKDINANDYIQDVLVGDPHDEIVGHVDLFGTPSTDETASLEGFDVGSVLSPTDGEVKGLLPKHTKELQQARRDLVFELSREGIVASKIMKDWTILLTARMADKSLPPNLNVKEFLTQAQHAAGQKIEDNKKSALAAAAGLDTRFGIFDEEVYNSVRDATGGRAAAGISGGPRRRPEFNDWRRDFIQRIQEEEDMEQIGRYQKVRIDVPDTPVGRFVDQLVPYESPFLNDLIQNKYSYLGVSDYKRPYDLKQVMGEIRRGQRSTPVRDARDAQDAQAAQGAAQDAESVDLFQWDQYANLLDAFTFD